MRTVNQQKNLSTQRLIWRLELNIYYLLETANKEFNQAIKNAADFEKKYGYFKRCQNQYIEITRLVRHNRKNKLTSKLLKLYYLEALLGKLQSNQNNLNQDPLDEETLLYNNQTLKKTKKSLDFLFTEANKLNEKIAKTEESSQRLLRDQIDLVNNIKSYFSSWKTTTNQLKAAYYYNFASSLANRVDNTNPNTNNATQSLKKAIHYLELSSKFYRRIEQYEAKKQTDQFKKAIEKKLQAIEKTSQPFKRKNISSLNEEMSPIKRVKKSPLTTHTIDEPNKDEINFEEKREQRTKEALEKSLEAISHDPDRYACYSKLFFVVAENLVVYTKESSNHTLLTKLSWLTTAYNLMLLSPDKNQAFIDETKQLIDLLHKKHNKTLHLISSQKRAQAYPTYSKCELQSKDLQELFVTETIDYYYGLNAFQLCLAGTYFLDTMLSLVKNQCDLYLTEKNTLEQIESLINKTVHIKVVHTHPKSLFCATLLRELVKFHICSENKAWLQDIFSLPDNVSSHPEYLRLLKTAKCLALNSGPKGREFIHKASMLENYLASDKKDNSPLSLSNSSLFPSSYFFQPQKEPVKAFLNVLKEHLKYLIKIRHFSTKPDIIYETILKFIQKQCSLHQISLNSSTNKLTIT